MRGLGILRHKRFAYGAGGQAGHGLVVPQEVQAPAGKLLGQRGHGSLLLLNAQGAAGGGAGACRVAACHCDLYGLEDTLEDLWQLAFGVVLGVGDPHPGVKAHQQQHPCPLSAERRQRRGLVNEERVRREAAERGARGVRLRDQLHHLQPLWQRGTLQRLVGVDLGQEQQLPLQPEALRRHVQQVQVRPRGRVEGGVEDRNGAHSRRCI
mmetsp:Transcript_3136/g.8487  ORF Transcript_3136/g.8487 Transcript_3136/m.8487 type:complete len:209 (-) Transcript_3136:161-787(-)